MNDLEDISWFVLKVRFQRALLAKEKLTKPDIEVYLPMEMRAVNTKCGGECIKLMPILSDLLFIKTSFRRVQEVCAAYKYLYYQSETINGIKKAIRIPEEQMTLFQEFISESHDNPNCKITKLRNGKKVVIKAGTFKGSTILFKEVRGKTTKEYIVEINGIDWDLTENSFMANILTKI